MSEEEESPAADDKEEEVPAADNEEEEVPATVSEEEEVPAAVSEEEAAPATVTEKEEVPVIVSEEEEVPVIVSEEEEAPAIVSEEEEASAPASEDETPAESIPGVTTAFGTALTSAPEGAMAPARPVYNEASNEATETTEAIETTEVTETTEANETNKAEDAPADLPEETQDALPASVSAAANEPRTLNTQVGDYVITASGNIPEGRKSKRWKSPPKRRSR